MKWMWLLLGLALIQSCQTQPEQKREKIDWLKANARNIRTIDPSDTDFRDLAFLKTELAGVQVIALGEQSHGDGSTFLAKARLIKFLHQEMGFEVLAFESGLMDCALAWQQLQNGIPADSAFSTGLFRIWSKSLQVKPVRNYVQHQLRKGDTLFLAGFDHQPSGNTGIEPRVKLIQDFILRWRPGLDTQRYAHIWQVLRIAKSGKFQLAKKDSVLQAGFFREADELATLAQGFPVREPADRCLQRAITQLRFSYDLYWRADFSNPADKLPNIRDSLMAENVLWLRKEIFPGRKFILWAANTHSGYNRQLLQYPDSMIPMGHRLRRARGSQYYVISFTSFTGMTHSMVNGNMPLPQASNKTLEALWAQTGAELAFLPAKALVESPFGSKFQARFFGFTNWKARWPEMMDGVMFVRDMEASKVL